MEKSKEEKLLGVVQHVFEAIGAAMARDQQLSSKVSGSVLQACMPGSHPHTLHAASDRSSS